MASNSKIISHKFENIHSLRLTGDFDEGSVHELINTLTKHDTGCGDIFRDTNELKKIHSFDRNIFQNNLDSIKM